MVSCMADTYESPTKRDILLSVLALKAVKVNLDTKNHRTKKIYISAATQYDTPKIKNRYSFLHGLQIAAINLLNFIQFFFSWSRFSPAQHCAWEMIQTRKWKSIDNSIVFFSFCVLNSQITKAMVLYHDITWFWIIGIAFHEIKAVSIEARSAFNSIQFDRIPPFSISMEYSVQISMLTEI